MENNEEMNKIEGKEKKRNLVKPMWVIILLLVIALVFLIYRVNNLNIQLNKESVNRTIIEIVPDKEWYKEECKCIEWKGEKTCLEGLKLNSSLGSLCYSQDGKTFSPSSTACSKYECEECFVSLKKKIA
jgi:hypothetical protein